jgi:hypothetical protein
MPFKSRAQRRKFAALLLSGDITPEQYERWNRETGRAELPERVKRKRKASSRTSKRQRARGRRVSSKGKRKHRAKRRAR